MSVEIAWKQNILVTDFHLLKSLLVVFGFGSQAFVCGFSRQNSCSEIITYFFSDSLSVSFYMFPCSKGLPRYYLNDLNVNVDACSMISHCQKSRILFMYPSKYVCQFHSLEAAFYLAIALIKEKIRCFYKIHNYQDKEQFII